MRLILVLYDLHMPGCHSLKDKRKIVKSLKEKLKARFNVSVAEVDHHDLWQRTTIAIARVAPDRKNLDSINSAIDKLVTDRFDVQVAERQYVEY